MSVCPRIWNDILKGKSWNKWILFAWLIISESGGKKLCKIYSTFSKFYLALLSLFPSTFIYNLKDFFYLLYICLDSRDSVSYHNFLFVNVDTYTWLKIFFKNFKPLKTNVFIPVKELSFLMLEVFSFIFIYFTFTLIREPTAISQELSQSYLVLIFFLISWF